MRCTKRELTAEVEVLRPSLREDDFGRAQVFAKSCAEGRYHVLEGRGEQPTHRAGRPRIVVLVLWPFAFIKSAKNDTVKGEETSFQTA